MEQRLRDEDMEQRLRDEKTEQRLRDEDMEQRQDIPQNLEREDIVLAVAHPSVTHSQTRSEPVNIYYMTDGDIIYMYMYVYIHTMYM